MSRQNNRNRNRNRNNQNNVRQLPARQFNDPRFEDHDENPAVIRGFDPDYLNEYDEAVIVRGNGSSVPENRPHPARKMQGHNKPSTRLAAEAQGFAKTTTIRFRGYDYVFDSDAATDLEIFEDLEAERYLSVARRLLGDDQWETLKDACRDPRTGRASIVHFEKFFQTFIQAVGPGNR